ncbi:MAG: hypothetical protein Q4C71_02700 [Microbacteriaceae bacterium]|nr:hypothetical protein [Microbacteriaceae bacterium]
MVARLTKLSLRLYRASFSSPWAIVGLVLHVLLLGALLFGVFMMFSYMSSSTEGIAYLPLFAVIFGALVVVSWIIEGIIYPAVDTLAPESFALLPVKGRDLARASLISTLFFPSGLALIIFSLITLFAWKNNQTAMIAAICVLPLVWLSTVLLAKVVLGLLATVLANKNLRMIVSVFVFLALYLGFVLLNAQFTSQATGDNSAAFDPATYISGMIAVATFLTYTPLAAAFGVPYHLAVGEPTRAAISGAIALVTVVVLFFIYKHQVSVRLTNPIVFRGSGDMKSGGLIDRLFPATPAGAIAARSVKYRLRDPRLILAVVIGPIVAFALPVAYSTFSNPVFLPYYALFIVLMIIGCVQADASYDYRALGLHIINGVRGIDDRAGRLMGMLPMMMIPALVIIPAVAMLYRVPGEIVPAVMIFLAASFTVAGSAICIGVIMPGVAPRPGNNPLMNSAKNGGGMQAFVGQLLSWALLAGLQAPMLVMFLFGRNLSLPWLAYSGLAVGLIIGVVTLIAGVKLAGKTLDKNWPELYAAVTKGS